MQKLSAILVDGTIYFSWLFIVSIGLTLIYGVMKILNIAHGSFYALGAYTAASAVGAYFAGNYPAAGSFLILIGAGMCGRRLLLLDEPFEGIAPALARRLVEAIAALRATGVSVLISESDYVHSGDVIDRLYVIERGVVTAQSHGANAAHR